MTRLLQPLIDTIRATIGSYVGMSITVVIDGNGVTVTTLEDSIDVDDIASSIVLPLPALCNAEPGSVLCLYAGSAGAFVDLAADIGYALDIGVGPLLLDQHRAGPAPVVGVTGTGDLSAVNQAIGILVDRGHTLDEAAVHLEELARRDRIAVPAAARDLIDRTCGHRGPQPPIGHRLPTLAGRRRPTPPRAPESPRSAA